MRSAWCPNGEGFRRNNRHKALIRVLNCPLASIRGYKYSGFKLSTQKSSVRKPSLIVSASVAFRHHSHGKWQLAAVANCQTCEGICGLHCPLTRSTKRKFVSQLKHRIQISVPMCFYEKFSVTLMCLLLWWALSLWSEQKLEEPAKPRNCVLDRRNRSGSIQRKEIMFKKKLNHRAYNLSTPQNLHLGWCEQLYMRYEPNSKTDTATIKTVFSHINFRAYLV